jgi:hypothetical protein
MFKVPKPMRRTKFDKLFSIEMNDFDVERLLPTLFNLVVSRGRNRNSGSNEKKSLSQFVDGLSRNERIRGFNTEKGRQLLEHWVRAASVKMSFAGRGKIREKLEFVLPDTLLTYKTGLPKPSSRQRNVPRFLYSSMCNAIPDGALNARRLNLQIWLKDVFGKGISMQNAPPYDGSYDNETDVDIHALLSLRLLEEFDTGAITSQELTEQPPLLPNQATQIGENILLILRGFDGVLPPAFVGRMLMAIINLDLLTYTLRLMSSVASLCRTGKAPSETGTTAGTEIYLDLTGDRQGQSVSLARSCVERDLEALGRYFENSLRLFTIHRMRELSTSLGALVEDDGVSVMTYLERIIEAEETQVVTVKAESELEQILVESQRELTSEEEKAQLSEEMKRRVTAKRPIDVLNTVLCETLRGSGVQKFSQWYRGVGGLNKHYGLLQGNVRGPRNWNYVLTDELLRALVYLCSVDAYRNNINEAQPSASLRLDEFLEWMRVRFGILIDRPPSEMESSSAREAAAENFSAFKLRLRQTGFFSGLSDDFNVQNLTVSLMQQAK